jgi:hypothetical protein
MLSTMRFCVRNRRRQITCLILVLAAPCASCGTNLSSNKQSNSPTIDFNAKPLVSEPGVEKRRPSPGTANLQGRVLFNEKPVADVEIKLCENFSTVWGLSCDGKTFTQRTDAEGTYFFADLPPITYGGVAARVFKTDAYVFIRSGIMDSAKFPLEADKTFFAPAVNLFKSDLKTTAPKKDSTVPAGPVEIKWEPYPDASYYKYTLSTDGDYIPDAPSYYEVRADHPDITTDKPLLPAKYGLKIQALNTNGVKLAEVFMRFTVAEETAAPKVK